MASLACKFDSGFAPLRGGPIASSSTVRQPAASLVVSPLSSGNEDEILAALSARSLTNVIMAGFIRDNGLANSLNRGRFYACHSEQAKLEGVALIGHTILFETFTEGAIEAFAAVARHEASPHLLMGKHDAVKLFWDCYADLGQLPRLVCPVLFLQRRKPFEPQPRVRGLRPAIGKDLEHVVRAQAAMALEMSGVDPLKKDPLGFRERYLRRIEKKRVWVLIKNGQLIFKTDIIAETNEAMYIEGVYVSPEERGKGLGRSCLRAVGRIFLERAKAVYLFVEDENVRAKSFYLKFGFSVAGQYDLLYF